MKSNKLAWLAGIAGAVAAATVAWRVTSRRQAVPCPTWLAWFVDHPPYERLLGTELTLDRIGLQPGQRVLEVGPGPGRLLVRAARRVLPDGEAVGLDIQSGMVEKLRMNAARAGVTNLAAVQGDAVESHFSPESFDVVYLCTALGEITNREAALARCYEALRPGGLLSITEMAPDPHYQTRETVRRLAEQAGFSPIAEHGRWTRYTLNFVRPGTQAIE